MSAGSRSNPSDVGRAIVILATQDLREQEVLTPSPGPDQVRVRVAYAGICGSDLHYYFAGANGAFVVREPLIPGHELSGTVDDDPSGTYAPGTPVSVHPATFGDCEPGLEGHRHLWPGGAYLGSAATWPHTQGGMSEFLLVARDSIRVLPPTLPLRRAALAEPLAVVLHGIHVAGGVKGKRVLVSGSGPIGLLAAAAALAKGAVEVVSTDVLPGPLRRAEALGVHRTVQVGHEELPDSYFDVVLECSGVAPAINAAIGAVRRAGILAQIGMLSAGTHPLALAALISKEIQLRGSFRFNDEIDEAVRLLDEIPGIGQIITHEFSADRAVEAFTTAKDSEESGKVIVNLWHAEATP